MQDQWREQEARCAATRWIRRSAIAVLLGAAWCAGVATAADGKAIFEAKCAGCHSIGGGPKIGPDLKTSLDKRGKEWMVSAIVDPSGAGLRPAMPNLGVAKAEAEAIVAHLATDAGAGKGTAAAPVPAGDPARGKALFTGASVLQSGAVSCIGCHNANGVGALGGGNLASDLSDAGTRYSHGEGVAALLKDMPIPAMNAVYGPRPLTEGEAADLAAFLGEQTAAQPRNDTLVFLGLGVIGMLLLAGLSQIIWRNRFKGVRQQLTGGR